ncbi:sigma-54-dependent transcriptional regulator [Geothrix fuzhouensis]|uniref:sigma-54-dependent transcriptional regulator n=1 Tax=Geothrix fuzhouensis TaxID=2966451 RepID=UPI0021478765|nr:sigma-54 dependent transcriptional regulator [Geothrix fuzhouensis]
MGTILIVDDEANLRRLLRMVLQEAGHRVVEAASVAEARQRLEDEAPDLVITDQKLGDGEGLDVMAAARQAEDAVPIVFLTAYATVELAVAAMRQGAFDVVQKPFDPEGIQAAVHRALEHGGLLKENRRLRRQAGHPEGLRGLLGLSAPMAELRDTLQRVAPTQATALITGETGTGKELVARALHALSPRAPKPFVAVNCAAMPETLLESELFGHERGAFTGADRAREGLFEAAHGGTLFLDEAGEMPPSLQAKLLRVMMDGMVQRVGSRTPRHVDVRLIAATHRDLPARVREGLFREDLYFRLAVVPIRVPPLREHLEDLPELCSHFLDHAIRDMGLPRRSLTPEALARLQAYPFPGNIRELRNLIERACILAKGPDIGPEDFPLEPGLGAPSPPDLETFAGGLPLPTDLPALVSALEEHLVDRALLESRGVQAEAARRLGISRSDLHYRLKRRGVQGS